MGLGKQRSRLGAWMDARKIKQTELAKASGVSGVTLTKLCKEDCKKGELYRNTAVKIIDALKKLSGERVGIDDFWA